MAIATRQLALASERPYRPLTQSNGFAGTRLGPWHLEHELGHGGMASVYSASHTRHREKAAIKVAHTSVFDGRYSPEMFLREARVIRRVRHPGVIHVVSTGTAGDCPYIVLEKLSGETLRQRLRTGPIPRADAFDALLELCDVLRAAHSVGVVHRDLKLDNIFVVNAPYQRDLRIKLLDWGVAYVDGEPDPFRGLIAGTMTYVAPDQIRGDTVTAACDVYSLGVLAFRLLCGRPPFVASSDLELCQMHLHSEPPRARTAWAHVPQPLDDLLHAMLAKRPEARPSLDEVERVLRGAHDATAPIRPRRCTPSVRTRRRPSRTGIDLDVLFMSGVLPAPPIQLGWLALVIAAFAWLVFLSS